MTQFQKLSAIAALLMSLILASPAFAIATVFNLKIANISVGGTALTREVAAITFAGTVVGPCTGANTTVMYFDLSTNKGKAGLSAATAAMLANLTVNAWGTGVCAPTPAGLPTAEYLDRLIVNAP